MVRGTHDVQVKEEKPSGKPDYEAQPKSEWVDELRAQQQKGQAGTFVPPIIYSSRTHSQLAQVIKELRATTYRCCAWAEAWA